MKTLIKTTLVALTLSFTALHAGSGHNHSHGSNGHSHSAPVQEEVTKASIKEIAKQKVKRLTLAKKIDDSWLFVPISKMKKIQFNHNYEWVISFHNSEIKEKTKQTLYIFISVYGDLIAANYTGK